MGRAGTGGFNRTFMELKCHTRRLASSRSLRFNRTFMELKLYFAAANSFQLAGFNRTFMELKCRTAGLNSNIYRFQSYLYGIEME